MRSSQTTPAIVLRARPYGESDKIVSFLTEDFGKLTGIAKGALRSRRRFVNSLEPFSLVNLRFQDRAHGNLAFLIGADLLFGLRQLASSLERISYAAYLVEITDGLIMSALVASSMVPSASRRFRVSSSWAGGTRRMMCSGEESTTSPPSSRAISIACCTPASAEAASGTRSTSEVEPRITAYGGRFALEP
jgi:hypothetical protein